jgi:hypothetical protein
MVFPKKAWINLAERLAGVFPAPQFDHANGHTLREFAPDKALRRALLNNAMRPRIRNVLPTLALFSQSLNNVERRRDTTQGALPLPVCFSVFHMVFGEGLSPLLSPANEGEAGKQSGRKLVAIDAPDKLVIGADGIFIRIVIPRITFRFDFLVKL